jgi:C4-dicarboxylate transporter
MADRKSSRDRRRGATTKAPQKRAVTNASNGIKAVSIAEIDAQAHTQRAAALGISLADLVGFVSEVRTIQGRVGR